MVTIDFFSLSPPPLNNGSVRRGLSSYPRQVFSKDDGVGIAIYAYLSAVQFANVIEGKATEKDNASVVSLQQDDLDDYFPWKMKRHLLPLSIQPILHPFGFGTTLHLRMPLLHQGRHQKTPLCS
jgi:hypothetical protein